MDRNETSIDEQIVSEPQPDVSEIQSEPDFSSRIVREKLDVQPLMRYAGFWMRFWAYLMDLIVVGSIDRIIINPLFRFLDISLYEFNMFAPISIATAITFYLYFVLMTKFFGQTLGKMTFGLRVVNLSGERLSWGTVLFREWIGRFISSAVVVGYIIVAFLPKKQGLHDIFVDTSVIHEE